MYDGKIIKDEMDKVEGIVGRLLCYEWSRKIFGGIL